MTRVQQQTDKANGGDHELANAMLPLRQRLPDTRQSLTHKFRVGDCEGYITVGLFQDGRPGEVFIKVAKDGTAISGLADTVGVLTSLALQYGVPVETLARKFEYVRFEPSGWTQNEEIRQAHSLIDYVFRWLGMQFSPTYRNSYRKVAPSDGVPSEADAIP
jgi:ribonucleoside-diphosphate reductase alpha chain